ncbi:MAG: arylformamidase [Paraglaciecola sp.]|jgi:arylformamidase
MTQIDFSDIDNINREYSPSSCIDDINIYIQQYIQLSRVARNHALEQNLLYQDIQYGDSKTQSLDLYLPISHPQEKLMVYIHGGYWQELSKEESSFAATNFQQQGFHFAVIDYTLAPDASITDIVAENRNAIAWLYKHAAQFGYKPQDIYVSGSSAGAHLAMLMLQTNWSEYVIDCQENIIKGVCAVSGIYDLQPLLPTYVNDLLSMDLNEAKKNSPVLQALPKPAPVIIAFGENETDEFKRQSKIMSDKLSSDGFYVQFAEIKGRNHFDVIMDLSQKSSWLSQQTIALMKSTE